VEEWRSGGVEECDEGEEWRSGGVMTREIADITFAEDNSAETSGGKL